MSSEVVVDRVVDFLLQIIVQMSSLKQMFLRAIGKNICADARSVSIPRWRVADILNIDIFQGFLVSK